MHSNVRGGGSTPFAEWAFLKNIGMREKQEDALSLHFSTAPAVFGVYDGHNGVDWGR